MHHAMQNASEESPLSSVHFSNSPIRTRRRCTRPRSSLWGRVELLRTFLKLPPSSVRASLFQLLARESQRCCEATSVPCAAQSHSARAWTSRTCRRTCSVSRRRGPYRIRCCPARSCRTRQRGTSSLRPPSTLRCSARCRDAPRCAPASPLPAEMHLIVGDSDWEQRKHNLFMEGKHHFAHSIVGVSLRRLLIAHEYIIFPCHSSQGYVCSTDTYVPQAGRYDYFCRLRALTTLWTTGRQARLARGHAG
jgi:hypothetical protein